MSGENSQLVTLYEPFAKMLRRFVSKDDRQKSGLAAIVVLAHGLLNDKCTAKKKKAVQR